MESVVIQHKPWAYGHKLNIHWKADSGKMCKIVFEPVEDGLQSSFYYNGKLTGKPTFSQGYEVQASDYIPNGRYFNYKLIREMALNLLLKVIPENVQDVCITVNVQFYKDYDLYEKEVRCDIMSKFGLLTKTVGAYKFQMVWHCTSVDPNPLRMWRVGSDIR